MAPTLTSRTRSGRGVRAVPILALLMMTVALCLAQTTSAQAATLSLNQCNNNGPGPRGATTSMRCTVVVADCW